MFRLNSLVFLCIFLLLSTSVSTTTTTSSSPSSKSKDEALSNPLSPKSYLIRYWNYHIANTLPKPNFLLSKASPLSPSNSAILQALANRNSLPSNLPYFCQSAKLFCFPDLSPSLAKYPGDTQFTQYATGRNFTNYGTNVAGRVNSFKNYSDSENLPINTFRRYGRDSVSHDERFAHYSPDGNVGDTSFDSYASDSNNGTSDFVNYDHSINVPNLRFGTYSFDGNTKKANFKSYSSNANAGDQSFRSYGRLGNAESVSFNSYAQSANVVGSTFSHYSEDGNAGMDNFTSYATNGNSPSNNFRSYGEQGSFAIESFSSYSDSMNGGDQSFQSYGKKGSGPVQMFKSYARDSNVVGSAFTNYGENSVEEVDNFTSYAFSSNVPKNTFRSYGDGAFSNTKIFNSYRDQANVGDDRFESYAKSKGGKAKFNNYGKSFNEGTDTFEGYKQGTGFHIYGINNSFKDYTNKSGISFTTYRHRTSLVETKVAHMQMQRWVEPGKFFRESMLKQGTVMSMPDIRDKMPPRSFLPRKLAAKLPFSMNQVSQLKEIFRGKDENSTMGKILEDTLKECEREPSEGETMRCVASIEDMIDFATSVLGRDVMVKSTESVAGSKGDIEIGEVVGLNGGKITKSVSCHQSLFPYMVYFCHSVPKVRVYEAEILDAKTKQRINRGVAICHIDTSMWGERHGAFLALGGKPGQIEVCHWIFENDMTWVVADY